MSQPPELDPVLQAEIALAAGQAAEDSKRVFARGMALGWQLGLRSVASQMILRPDTIVSAHAMAEMLTKIADTPLKFEE